MYQLSRRRALLLLSSSVALAGFRSCQKEQGSLADLVNTLGRAMSQLMAVAGDSVLAGKLGQATALAMKLLQAWTPGQDASQIIEALNEMISIILNATGLEKFKPLVTLVLGTIASIIEQLKGSPHTNIRITRPPHTSEEFKQDWDSIRAGSMDMEQAPIL